MILRSHSAYPSIAGSFPIKRIDHSSFVILTAPVFFSSSFAKVVLPAPINPQIRYTIGFLLISVLYQQTWPSGLRAACGPAEESRTANTLCPRRGIGPGAGTFDSPH